MWEMQVAGLEPDENSGVWADPELRQEGVVEPATTMNKCPRTLITARTRASTSRSMSFDGSPRAVTKERERAVER